MSIKKPMDALLEARLQFRNLLDTHGLALLAGGEADALSWLEFQIIELADMVSRRERFLKLVRQVREGLERVHGESKVARNDERKERGNPYIEARFRRIII